MSGDREQSSESLKGSKARELKWAHKKAAFVSVLAGFYFVLGWIYVQPWLPRISDLWTCYLVMIVVLLAGGFVGFYYTTTGADFVGAEYTEPAASEG